MTIYHGSTVLVEKPEIRRSERMLDFGAGFYTTSYKEQAIRWAQRVANDQVYTTVTLYEQGVLSKEAAVIDLKISKLYNQILFHSEKSLEFCKYIRHFATGV